MPGDQEQDRAYAEGVADDRVDDVPGPAEVQQQGSGVEYVGEKAIEHGHPYNRMVLPLPENVDHEGDHVGAAGKGDTRDHIEADPESPGVFLRKVGDRSQSLSKADRQQNDAEQNDQPRYHVKGRDDFSLRLQLLPDEATKIAQLAAGSGERCARDFHRQTSLSVSSFSVSFLPFVARCSPSSRGGRSVSTTGTA